jgi:hypothetical protein
MPFSCRNGSIGSIEAERLAGKYAALMVEALSNATEPERTSGSIRTFGAVGVQGY